MCSQHLASLLRLVLRDDFTEASLGHVRIERYGICSDQYVLSSSSHHVLSNKGTDTEMDPLSGDLMQLYKL